MLFWEGASLWILSAPPGQQYPRTAPHRHHVVQVTVALTGTIDFEGQGTRVAGEVVAIAPDSLHAFEGTGLVAHVFIDSDSRQGRQIAQRLFSEESIVPIPASQLDTLPQSLKTAFEGRDASDDELRALGRSLILRLAGDGAGAEVPDARIAKLIAWLALRLDETVSLKDAAAFVGLSPGRTRHLFIEQTGLPLRTYVLWLRLMRAVELYASRASLTEAAHGAGFADSAHLSRTFRRMFGVAADSLRVS